MPESKTSPAAEKQAAAPKTDPAAQTEREAKPGDRLPDVPDSAYGEDAVPVGPPPGVYAYVHGSDCVYPHVPLTARAARPARDPDPDVDGDEGEPAAPATVFDWPFGPPDDGRWTPTRSKPNQLADNAPAASSEE